ncbi:MAG: GNAT family N-acetyltransferase [Chloroflexota bacterium]
MTLHELSPQLYSRVQQLFDGQANPHLFCAGILAGKYPGKVIVDHPEHPRSAMVIKDGNWCYLGGAPTNLAFTQALRVALASKQFISENANSLLFFAPITEWETVLETLVAQRLPIATPRFLYIANAAQFNAPPATPNGFSIRFMDESLREATQGELPKDVQNVLELRRSSSIPDEAAFGFVALHDSCCVSWSMIDVIVGTRGDIGLFTKPNYRRKGLSMATSGATIQYGLSHGLTDIHWDVVSYNTASVHMAEKHGLQRSHTYNQNLILFGEMAYRGTLAYQHLDENRFQNVLDVCESLFDLEDGPRYGHFLSGAAWAGLGQSEKALSHLHKAIEFGWDDLFDLESLPPLKIFHGTEEWDDIVARVKANMKND